MKNINETELDKFLGNESEENTKVVKSDKSLIERVDKKIIVDESGRQLLM
jgi:hypothetical protein